MRKPFVFTMNSFFIVFFIVFICGYSHSSSSDSTTAGTKSLKSTSVEEKKDKKASEKEKTIRTIEDAENFIASRGIKLLDKQEHQKVTIGKRVFKYKVGGVRVILIEFDKPQEMHAWADMADSSPIRGSKVLRKCTVAIQIWRGPDGPRQELIHALEDKKE